MTVSAGAALLIQFISERFDVNNTREGLIRLSPFFFYAPFSFADYTLLLRFLVYTIVPFFRVMNCNVPFFFLFRMHPGAVFRFVGRDNF